MRTNEQPFHTAILFLLQRHQDADALYAFKSRGFGGEIGVVTVNNLLVTTQDFPETASHTVLRLERQ